MVGNINLLSALTSTTNGNNTILGGAGNDTITAYGNNNILDGGLGNDVLTGVGNYNILSGGDGNDLLNAIGNYNILDGGAGNDTLNAWGNSNMLFGGTGDDILNAWGNNNMLFGGDGNDTLNAYGNGNYLNGDGINSILPTLQNLMQQAFPQLFPQYQEPVYTPTSSGSSIDISSDGRGFWGDPHFELKGANGEEIKFDHKGVDGNTYNVFQGDNITIDAKYEQYKDPNNPQIMGELAIDVGGGKISWDKDGKPTYNGQELAEGDTTLNDGTKINYKDGNMTIASSDGSGQIDISTDQGWFNIDPSGNFSNADGIIGKAVSESRALTNEECNKYDVTTTRPIE